MVGPSAPSANWLRNKAFAWSDDPTPARYARDFACTLLLMALATLGVSDVTLYDGAWSEWGARDDLPVEPAK